MSNFFSNNYSSHQAYNMEQPKKSTNSRLEYFKDNYQDPNDIYEDFDPNEYYYRSNTPTSAQSGAHTQQHSHFSMQHAAQHSTQQSQMAFSGPSQAFNQQFSNMALSSANGMDQSRHSLMGSPPPTPPTSRTYAGAHPPTDDSSYAAMFKGAPSMQQRTPPAYSNPPMPYSASTLQQQQQQRRAPYAAIAAQHLHQQQQTPAVLPHQMMNSMMQQPQHQQSPPQQPPQQSFTQQQSLPPKKRGFDVDEYGLLGILNVIRMLDKDHCALALGYDLTTLGLNLNSSMYLYTQFAAPWSHGEGKVTPQFTAPKVYTELPVKKISQEYFSKFNDETLFYIFYSMPRDKMQMSAAAELSRRNWMYHTKEKFWFCKVNAAGEWVQYEQVSRDGEVYEHGKFRVFNFDTFRIEEAVRTISLSVRYQQPQAKGGK